MQIKYSAVLWSVFWVLLAGLIIFCILFATPFLSGHMAINVLHWAGCEPTGFGSPYHCAEESWIGERFGPLTGLFFVLALLAPFIFLLLFWDVLLIWAGLIVVSGVIAARLEEHLPEKKLRIAFNFSLPASTPSRYAGFFQRMCAVLFDGACLYAMAYLFAMIAYVFLYRGEFAGLEHGLLRELAIRFFPWVALIGCLIWKADTPGKRLMSIRVVDAASEQPITVYQFIKRCAGFLFSVLCFGLGVISVGFDRRKQGWHDHFANTLVIRKV